MNIRIVFCICFCFCVFIVSMTSIRIFSPPIPKYTTIQDIWILDNNQSTRWLEALKSKEIKVDDLTINVYFDREHFQTIIRKKYNDMDSDRLN